LACPVYAVDSNGCKLCQCVTPTCDALTTCSLNCIYGKVSNLNGCPTCQCNACPTVNCTKPCAYGFAVDATSGCQLCDCAPQPVCTASGTAPVSTTTTATTAPAGCNLACTNGYSISGGCVTCVCNINPVCTCSGAIPTVVTKCLDGSTAQYTDHCVVEPNNTCHYFFKKCPIGIVLVLSKGTFTSADLNQFLTNNRIPPSDVTFSVTSDPKTGNQIVTFFVNSDAIPAGITDTGIASGIQSSATLNGNQGYAYVLSGNNTSSSFGNVIVVSFLGMLIALFM